MFTAFTKYLQNSNNQQPKVSLEKPLPNTSDHPSTSVRTDTETLTYRCYPNPFGFGYYRFWDPKQHSQESKSVLSVSQNNKAYTSTPNNSREKEKSAATTQVMFAGTLTQRKVSMPFGLDVTVWGDADSTTVKPSSQTKNHRS